MTEVEYLLKIKEARINHERIEEDIMRQYALAHNDIHVGDIIKDHVGHIKVDVVGLVRHYGNEMPYCYYKGECVKKDGTPFKKPERRTIHQINLLTP